MNAIPDPVASESEALPAEDRILAELLARQQLKDVMSREILQQFRRDGIGFASSSLEIVGLPPLRLQRR